MATKNAKTKWSRNSAPAERSTTTETTTTEVITRPAPARATRSNNADSRKGRRDKQRFSQGSGSTKRAWEIRPHETKFALPGPGTAVNTNDESWYIGKLRDQAERYGALPWTAIAGDALRVDDYSAVVNYGSPAVRLKLNALSRTFPSVMAAGLIPALGNTIVNPEVLDKPWMTTAEQKLAYLQSKVSGSLPFHAADLVCYWFAAADIFAEIAQAERALKIARTWMTYENVSYPKQLCAAMGWDFDSIMGNVRIFEGQIQEVINLANTLLLPKDLALVERWYFLYSHIFKDSNLITAKLYGYRKDAYYTFEETLVDTGSALKFHFAPSLAADAGRGYWTPTTWFTTTMRSLNKLLPGRSTAVVDIMAKLLRAYDISTFFAYPNVSSEGLEPKFDPEALTAFANMNMTGIVNANHSDPSVFDIVQNVDSLTLTYRGSVFVPGIYIPDTNILRAWESKPSVGTLFEMTRLTCCQAYDPSLASGWMYTGTEIVSMVDIYTGAGETDATRMPVVTKYQTSSLVIENTDPGATWKAEFNAMNLWQRFEYAPLIVATGANMGAKPQIGDEVTLIADMDNYAAISASVLQRIHRVAIANLWGVQTDFVG